MRFYTAASVVSMFHFVAFHAINFDSFSTVTNVRVIRDFERAQV